jgi:phospholipid/cholesterol/gamma-HCH transport system ATP-binding protein
MTPAGQNSGPDEPPAVAASGLECGYDGDVILTDVSFNIWQGEIYFVIGGSGCGKSTLLRNLVGLNQPTKGEVRFFGKPFSTADLSERRAQLKTFGMLFQSGALWTSLTLRENVALPLEEHTDLARREIDAIAGLKLAQVGLGGFEDYYSAEISGGMKKRAALARALALDPQIVFFDEPWAGLDPVTSYHLDELLLQIQATMGTTLVVVSQDLASIFDLADRVLMLHRDARGIIAEGDPRELAETNTDPRVQEFLHRRPLHRELRFRSS